jgi:hypothetical protein
MLELKKRSHVPKPDQKTIRWTIVKRGEMCEASMGRSEDCLSLAGDLWIQLTADGIVVR